MGVKQPGAIEICMIASRLPSKMFTWKYVKLCLFDCPHVLCPDLATPEYLSVHLSIPPPRITVLPHRCVGCIAVLSQRCITANLRTNIIDFRGFDSSIIVIQRGGILKGWNFHVHRGFPGIIESSNVSRDNVSREIGRIAVRQCRVAVLCSCCVLASLRHIDSLHRPGLSALPVFRRCSKEFQCRTDAQLCSKGQCCTRVHNLCKHGQ